MKKLRLLDRKQNTLLSVMEGDRFIPKEKMRHLAEQARSKYMSAQPFPHLVLDDFFDLDVLHCVEQEFPSLGMQQQWQQYRAENEWLKNSTNEDQHIPFFTRHFLYALNSATFMSWLEAITGIKPLVPDTEFIGGGFHSTLSGGKLDLHADFNVHLRNRLDRRINVILFLNREWPEEYGGHLELWDKDLSRPPERILPIFNRLVIFGTNDFTYHGQPVEITCPEHRYRKSLALYYYSNGRPANEKSDANHLTLFKKRPDL